jgi:hypothetical protein
VISSAGKIQSHIPQIRPTIPDQPHLTEPPDTTRLVRTRNSAQRPQTLPQSGLQRFSELSSIWLSVTARLQRLCTSGSWTCKREEGTMTETKMQLEDCKYSGGSKIRGCRRTAITSRPEPFITIANNPPFRAGRPMRSIYHKPSRE